MKIKNKTQHAAALERIDRLMDYKAVKELDELSQAVSIYEDKRWPITRPTPQDIIKAKIEELEIKQCEMAARLGMSRSHFSEFMNGHRLITIQAIRIAVSNHGMSARVLLEID